MIEWLGAKPQSDKRPTFFLTQPVHKTVKYVTSGPKLAVTVAIIFSASCKHKILLDDYKVRPELNKHKNI